ncbi:hypothetical protein G7Y89_g4863 [Cudoniella acicularis]|uniref:Uncharacterized protein n=1 Tax=Cudoniella acicularis TaxID=354080 RepID=A0A8H4RNL0_9HELO|nr:hypothetical protein G7Y89_g4863 [Cudoniella acicularis]
MASSVAVAVDDECRVDVRKESERRTREEWVAGLGIHDYHGHNLLPNCAVVAHKPGSPLVSGLSNRGPGTPARLFSVRTGGGWQWPQSCKWARAASVGAGFDSEWPSSVGGCTVAPVRDGGRHSSKAWQGISADMAFPDLGPPVLAGKTSIERPRLQQCRAEAFSDQCPVLRARSRPRERKERETPSEPSPLSGIYFYKHEPDLRDPMNLIKVPKVAQLLEIAFLSSHQTPRSQRSIIRQQVALQSYWPDFSTVQPNRDESWELPVNPAETEAGELETENFDLLVGLQYRDRTNDRRQKTVQCAAGKPLTGRIILPLELKRCWLSLWTDYWSTQHVVSSIHHVGGGISTLAVKALKMMLGSPDSVHKYIFHGVQWTREDNYTRGSHYSPGLLETPAVSVLLECRAWATTKYYEELLRTKDPGAVTNSSPSPSELELKHNAFQQRLRLVAARLLLGRLEHAVRGADFPASRNNKLLPAGCLGLRASAGQDLEDHPKSARPFATPTNQIKRDRHKKPANGDAHRNSILVVRIAPVWAHNIVQVDHLCRKTVSVLHDTITGLLGATTPRIATQYVS